MKSHAPLCTALSLCALAMFATTQPGCPGSTEPTAEAQAPGEAPATGDAAKEGAAPAPEQAAAPQSSGEKRLKNVRQLVVRSGLGAMPLSLRALAIVLRATRWLSFFSSP